MCIRDRLYWSGDLTPTGISGETEGLWFTGRDSEEPGYCTNVFEDKGFDGYDLEPLGYYDFATGCNKLAPSFCPVDADRILDVPGEGLRTEPPLEGVFCTGDGYLAQRTGSGGAGCYVVSWYSRGVPNEDGTGPVYSGDYRVEIWYGSDSSGWGTDEYSMVWEIPIGSGIDAIRWEDVAGVPNPKVVNKFILYDDAPQLEIRIYPSTEADPDETGAVEIYALQLERAGNISACGEVEIDPSPFERTEDRLIITIPNCHDLDGSSMRSSPLFVKKCDYLCSNGLRELPCDPAEIPEEDLEEYRPTMQRCYYETTFGITLSELERGDKIPSGNIAIGNFNYRTLEVGLNFVGTNIIDCTQSQTPSTCYSNSFIEYSMEHGGNVWVRNHVGDEIGFSLTNAWIEHAKGIAAEMVYTNPMTSSHSSLIADYMKPEFRGRPLTGQYTLKIWDSPELNWDAIEDMQFLVRYRYWTRHTE